MDSKPVTSTLSRYEEWRAPGISVALLTFLALTPLISHRTLRLASQGVLLAGIAVHIYKDGKLPFFIGKLRAHRNRPTLYGTGSSNPLGPITDSNREVVGREPMEKLYTVSFEEVASRRAWYGMKRETSSLPTEPFKLPSSLISQNPFSFRYGGHLIQAIPGENFKLLPGFKLPASDERPANWVSSSFGNKTLLISTDPAQWTLATGWKRLLIDDKGKLFEPPDQTVPEPLRLHLTIGSGEQRSIATQKHTLTPVTYRSQSEVSIQRTPIGILLRGKRIYLLSESSGLPHCDLLILGRGAPNTKGVTPAALRSSTAQGKTVIKVVDCRSVRGADQTSMIFDRGSWRLTNEWQAWQIGESGRLIAAAEQTLPSYFRKNPLILTHPNNKETLSPQGRITVDLTSLPHDERVIQIVAKGRDLSIACLAQPSQPSPQAVDRYILLNEGVSLDKLQFTVTEEQISIACGN